jgi:very-short-patch-repair endonuclease
MQYYILAITIIIIILILISSNKNKNQYTYKKRENFFSKNELNFYKQLQKEVDNSNLTIFAKVRLADLIEPKKHDSTWQAHFNKICSKHVDFLLYDTTADEPKLIIELDDRSHDRADRQERDTFVDQALQQAGIPILHTRSSENLKEEIQKAII